MVVFWIILKIFLYIMLFLAGLAVLLLVIPFSYSGEAMIFEGCKLKINLGWAWNFIKIRADIEDEDVSVTFRVLDKSVYRLKSDKSEEEEEPKQKEPEKEKKRKKRGPALKDLTNKEFIHEISEYIKKVISIAKPKYLHLYGTYGFDDPAFTGLACGFLGIVKAMVPDARLELSPVFDEEIIDLDFRVQGSMIAGTVAYQTIRTVFKKPVRRILFKKKKLK